MKRRIKSVPLYLQTLEWIHWSKIGEPTRIDVGNYWHDKQAEYLEGAKGAALTDAVVFFFRLAGAAGLGKFISAGKNRPTTLLRADLSAIESLVSPTADSATNGQGDQHPADTSVSLAESAGFPVDGAPAALINGARTQTTAPARVVTASPAVHINLEIHIAADATPQTVAEIFKNMRKYVLNDPDSDA